ncbi:hypothetical protein M9435_004434 [Picochlorum sp. BPE23]|nr:hypothetical protein M9435_004434 [Picochlorum sp. BPE23]
MDIAATLPKSGSTTWADEVEAEEAEFGQAPLPIDSAIHHDRYEPVSPIYGRTTKSAPAPKKRTKIPDKPPYRAFIGNVAYDLTEDAVEEFLDHKRVVEILITRYRDTGKAKGCYIEFQNVDDLKAVLDKDGQTLAGRDAHVQVAQPRDKKPDARRRQPRRNEKGRKDASSRGGAWEPPMPTEESLKARPVLKLKPRSQKIQNDDVVVNSDSSRANPFGGARPADTASKLAELEIRDKVKSEPAESKDGERNTEPREKSRSKDSRKKVEPKGPEYFKEATVLTKIDNPFDLLAEDDA